MANVFDAARYILVKKGIMTAQKLQKLCFFSQAWSLIWDEEELFPEEFQAWPDGPVCPALYDWHQEEYEVSAEDLPKDRLSGDELGENALATLDAVLEAYGDKDGPWLARLTRHEHPWLKARGGLGKDEPSDAKISEGSMAWYYEKFAV